MMSREAAARHAIARFELVNGYEDPEGYEALLEDEAFTIACSLWQRTKGLSLDRHGTQANEDAREALKRSVREHAQRVLGHLETEVDA